MEETNRTFSTAQIAFWWQEVESSTEVGDCEEGVSSFSGLGTSSAPVGICQSRTLDPVLSLDDALREIQAAVTDYNKHKSASSSGIIRIQVCLFHINRLIFIEQTWVQYLGRICFVF